METVVIYGSRWKAAVLLAGGVALFALCLLMISDPSQIRSPQFSIPLFTGFATLVIMLSGSHFVRRPTLTLTPTGLVQKTFYGEMVRAWDQMETPWAVKNVVWNLKPGAPPSRSWISWLNRLCGYDENLFGMWTLSPKVLLELMRRYHAAATGGR